jgi:UDP-N-acetylmuramate dehydrogenase
MPDLRGRLSLAPLTWFRVGGPAQMLFTPADEDDLAYFLSKLPRIFRSIRSASVRT